MTSNFRLSKAFLEEVVECRPHGQSVMTGDLFFPMPDQWGYRGDPYLWAALAVHMMPNLEDIDDFRQAFYRAFEDLTGERFNDVPETLVVDRFAHGGMSSGGISVDWWRRVGLPLLHSRFVATQSQLGGA